MQEQLAKIQQDMKEKIEESQNNLLGQLAQLLAREREKGKSTMGNNNEDPIYPPGFAPVNTQPQLEVHPRMVPVTIRPQQYQAKASTPMNILIGSSSNLGDNPANLLVPDLDDMAEMEKGKVDMAKQLDDRCKWLEEKFKTMETADYRGGIDAKDLSLVPDLVLPPKFKTPEFKKYNGTSCPEAHITMFCRRMTGYVNNDQLLIHCFQDSLIGSAAKWYNPLSRAQIGSWKDLAQAFMKQYGHVTDIAPDKITLQNMEKKPGESFRQYAQRWREIAMQVQPPLLEKETTILFINTLKAPFITHMIGNTTKSFSDMVMAGEMIENAIRGGKIEVGETTKRSVPKKRENEVNSTSSYNRDHSRLITVNQPKVTTRGQQGSTKQESSVRQIFEKLQFTPISMSYKELYQSLFDSHVVSTFYIKPLQPSYPKWYDSNAQCDYHAGVSRHSIENCTAFKKTVERLLEMGIVKFDDTLGTKSPLSNHDDKSK
ncbi:uncharacterized protein [Gossypium hirsutum]|uniref:Retrotransposon gag domain-containing protein n=1 Tax=Gossypium hirsutum TaxID=3635 RepID=A0A1U8NFL9_GOSHI|nr:uncharacterized protein LOC107947771 [Gossypium hirsutum]